MKYTAINLKMSQSRNGWDAVACKAMPFYENTGLSLNFEYVSHIESESQISACSFEKNEQIWCNLKRLSKILHFTLIIAMFCIHNNSIQCNCVNKWHLNLIDFYDE